MEIFSHIAGKEIQVVVTLLLSAIFCFIGFKKKMFTLGASIVIAILALVIVFQQDVYLLIFPFLFAGIGSVISRNESPREHHGRTVVQVLANAGPAILALFVFGDPIHARNVVIAVFAIALADTMSSELGKKWGGTTVDFCSRKKMKPGLSGGISLQGSLAGLLGSFIIATATFIYGIDLRLFSLVLGFGFIGMLMDSIIGSIAQGKYLVGEEVKEVGERHELIRGFHWLNNDLVNFISILVVSFSMVR